MKKALLTCAVLGVSAVPAMSASLRVDQDTFSSLDLTLRITGQHLGKARSDVKNWTDFAVRRATINMAGQVHKRVKFDFEGEFSSATTRRGDHGGSVTINDAVIELDFADEFKIRAGRYRVPFARVNLTSSRAYIIPTGINWGVATSGIDGSGYRSPGVNPFQPATLAGDRDAGLTVWGNIAGGMFQYRVGIFDGRYDHTNTTLGRNDHLAYAIRLEFNPTMAGFKPENRWGKNDSYLGRQNVLNIGVGYWAQKWERSNYTGPNRTGTHKAWAVDLFWEQKVGEWIPNLQMGYINNSDLPSNLGRNNAKPETNAYYIKGQILYDKVVGIGKPALAFGYEYTEYKDFNLRTLAQQNPATVVGKGKVNRFSVFANYYIKGWNAVVSGGVDVVNPNGAMKLYNSDCTAQGVCTYRGKNFTDWTVALQVIF